jgi:hypothetical protein
MDFFLNSLEQNIEESAAPESGDGEPIPLPDIKQVLQKKAMEQMAKAEEEEKEATTVKIKRTDKAAMARVRPFFKHLIWITFNMKRLTLSSSAA